MDVAPTFAAPTERVAAAGEREQTELWWIFLAAGVAWLVFSLLVFQFDETSVTAISVLVGVACLGGAVLELAAVPASQGWWRAARIALAAAFAIIGVVAFVNPGDSFNALAAIFAFYLLARGVFEVVGAFLVRGVDDMWWLALLAGAAQILLAFWAAGNFGNKAFLLVVWVGASALAHGFLQIVHAFALRPR
jgi:uncharacterized membrane protein HdeD (DUF308 family)